MEFINPSVKEVFNTLAGNDQLVDFLKSKGLILTKEALYEQYEKETADKMNMYVYTNNVNMIYDLAETLVAYEDTLKEKQIWELLSNKVAWDDIASSLGITSKDLTGEIYKQILYCYKYCCVSSFFQNNKATFMPESDFYELEQNGAGMAFYDAIMKEFDKLDSVINKCIEYTDYDKIPWDLLNYLTQLLGFEKSTINADEDMELKFRELAKNILDIYRIKGTSYSFQLLFNFLGFNIEIKEYYFDRRLYYTTNSAGNSETSSSNNSDYEYYLTVHNPTENQLENIGTSEVVLPSDITPQYSLHEFSELCREYGPEAVLGYSPVYHVKDELGNILETKEYTGKVYKYFKTNLVYYSVGLEKANLTEKQIIAVAKYLDFLTPSYIMRQIQLETYSEKTTEGIGFDGDGTKTPDIYGNYNGFELLDSEDWESSYQKEFVKTNNGKMYYVDENNYDGTNETFKEYKDSINDGKFRLPLGYSIKRASLSKHLTGGTGTNYLSRKRTKYYIYYQNNTTNSFAYNEENVIITPYYTIPPYIGKTHYNFLDYKFYEKTNKVNLLGGDGNGGEECVKTQIRDAKLKRNVDFVTDKTLEDFIATDEAFNELTYGRINGRTLVVETTIKYGAGQKYRSAYDAFKKELSSYHICNIKNGGDNFNDDIYEEQQLLAYYKHPEILKSLMMNGYFLAKNGNANSGYIRLYRYGSYPRPIKKSNYESTYLNYLRSFKYVLKKAYNGSIGENIAINGSYVSKTTLAAAQETVNNYYDKMLQAVADNPSDSSKWYDLNYIEDKTFLVVANGNYYKAIKEYIPSAAASDTYAVSKKTHVFNSLAEAEAHFNSYPEEKINNAEFYVKGDGLYGWYYKNRVNETLIFSIQDEQLYRVIGNSKNDILKYDNFYGCLTIKRYKEIEKLTPQELENVNSVYVLGYDGINFTHNSGLQNNEGFRTDGIMYEYNKSDDLGDRQRYVLADDGDFVKCYIDDYDAHWEGYDEEADEEDFIFYNSNHIISWDTLGITNEPISRPVKNITDKDFDEELSQLDDYYNYINGNSKAKTLPKSGFDEIHKVYKYYKTSGQKIVGEITENTIDNFTDKEKINWEKNYHPYPAKVGTIIRHEPAIVYEKTNNGDFKATKDTVTQANKEYWSYGCTGLLSIVEENLERITGVSYDREFDYYSSLSTFFQDFYRMILLNDFSKESIPSKILFDKKIDEVTPELIEDIKYYYTMAVTQISGILDTITKDRVYYQFVANWKSLVSGSLADKTKFPDWKDEYLSDPFNSIADINKVCNNKYSGGSNCYYFNEKTSFMNVLRSVIKKLSINFGDNYKLNELDNGGNIKNLLGKDAYSLEKINNYEAINGYKYYYKNFRGTEVIVNINGNSTGKNDTQIINGPFYLTHDSNYNFFVPYTLNYGLHNYSKDFYNKHKEIYSEFTELLDLFNSLSTEDTNNFLKQYLYNKLTRLYRESEILDTLPLGVRSDGKRPMQLMPKLAEKYNGRAGRYKSPGTLLGSYYNNGGEDDDSIRLKFFKFDLKVDKYNNAEMKFYINRKDFIDSFGYDFNRYYMKRDLSSVKSNSLKAELRKVIELMYVKQFANIKPNFYYYDEHPSYYQNYSSIWQAIKPKVSKDYASAEVVMTDSNYLPITDSNGNLVDEHGDIILESNTSQIKERLASGEYIILTVKDDANTWRVNNPSSVFSINGVNKAERDNIYGYLNVRKLTQKYIDNYISFPQSLEWIERDDNNIASEYISFGDDRSINISMVNKLFARYEYKLSKDARVFKDKKYFTENNGDFVQVPLDELNNISSPIDAQLYEESITYDKEYYEKYINSKKETQLHNEEVIKVDANKYPFVYDGNNETILKNYDRKLLLEDQGYKPVYINTVEKPIKENADKLKTAVVVDGEEKNNYICDNIYYDPDGNLILSINNSFLHTSNIKLIKLIYKVLFITLVGYSIRGTGSVQKAKYFIQMLIKSANFIKNNVFYKVETFINNNLISKNINTKLIQKLPEAFRKLNILINSINKTFTAKFKEIGSGILKLMSGKSIAVGIYNKIPNIFKKINIFVKSISFKKINYITKKISFINNNLISKNVKEKGLLNKYLIRINNNILPFSPVLRNLFNENKYSVLLNFGPKTKKIINKLSIETFVPDLQGYFPGPIFTIFGAINVISKAFSLSLKSWEFVNDSSISYKKYIDDKNKFNGIANSDTVDVEIYNNGFDE